MPHLKSKKSGRIFHDVDSQTAALFVDAGLSDYFTPTQTGSKVAPAPTVPTFAVVMNQGSNKFEIVLTHPGGGVARFAGPPAQARNAFKAMAWSAAEQARTLQGPEPPENILREYADVYALPSKEADAFVMSKERAERERAEAEARQFKRE
jgi:hypothetical protein